MNPEDAPKALSYKHTNEILWAADAHIEAGKKQLIANDRKGAEGQFSSALACYQNVIRIFVEAGQFAQAKIYLDEAAAIFKDHGYQPGIEAMETVAGEYKVQLNIDTTRIERADLDAILRLHTEIITNHIDKGNYAAATQRLLVTYKTFKQIGYQDGLKALRTLEMAHPNVFPAAMAALAVAANDLNASTSGPLHNAHNIIAEAHKSIAEGMKRVAAGDDVNNTELKQGSAARHFEDARISYGQGIGILLAEGEYDKARNYIEQALGTFTEHGYQEGIDVMTRFQTAWQNAIDRKLQSQSSANDADSPAAVASAPSTAKPTPANSTSIPQAAHDPAVAQWHTVISDPAPHDRTLHDHAHLHFPQVAATQPARDPLASLAAMPGFERDKQALQVVTNPNKNAADQALPAGLDVDAPLPTISKPRSEADQVALMRKVMERMENRDPLPRVKDATTPTRLIPPSEKAMGS